MDNLSLNLDCHNLGCREDERLILGNSDIRHRGSVAVKDIQQFSGPKIVQVNHVVLAASKHVVTVIGQS